MSTPLLIADNLAKTYSVRHGLFKFVPLHALQDASFVLEAGKTLAVVGESGCGKSTLARLITGIEKPSAGMLNLSGMKITHDSKTQHKTLHKTVQMIFQNPYGSLNPRQRIGSILEEPLKINTSLSRKERNDTVQVMLTKVGLRPEHASRYPHMFSGGQRQRIVIARALILQPQLVVADEPVSALDVSVQAQILNLLADLQTEFKLAYIFISHNLSVVEHIADDIIVMYLGRIVESGSRDQVLQHTAHPYTKALLASTPSVRASQIKKRQHLAGELPSPLAPPPGCAFHTRCPFATDICHKDRPLLREVAHHQVACHHAEKVVATDH